MMSRVLLVVGVLAVCGVHCEQQHQERDFSHITHEGHVDGFVLDHVWAMERGELVKYQLGKTSRKAQPFEFEAFDPNVRSAARTRSLAKLAMVAAYLKEPPSSLLPLSKEIMDPIITAGDGIYSRVSYEAEVAEMTRLGTVIYNEVLAVTDSNFTKVSSAYPTALIAFNFVTPANLHVLVFRGSASMLDTVDSASMVIPHLASGKGKENSKTAWETDAGLEWTDYQQGHHDKDTASDRTTLHNDGKVAVVGLFNMLGFAALAPTGITPVVQQVALAWIAYVRSLSGSMAAITGHALGGSRAAVASMTIKERTDFAVQTLTFGGVGAACWPRTNYFGRILLNSSTDQQQITEYVHPLDITGHQLGRDVGSHCFVGKQDITTSNAMKWCRNSSGLDPAYVMRLEVAKVVQPFVVQTRAQMTAAMNAAVQSGSVAAIRQVTIQNLTFEGLVANLGGFTAWLNQTEEQDYISSQQCKYFTHRPLPLYDAIVAELNADGSTKSGCGYTRAVAWGGEQCPWNFPAQHDDDDDFFTGKPGGPAFIVFITITFIVFVVGIATCCSRTEEDMHSEWDPEEEDQFIAEQENADQEE